MVIRMRKQIMRFALVLVLALGFPAAVRAGKADKTVTLTKDNTIIYTDGSADIANAFEGMAPGDSKTVTIRVQNESDHTADFFLSQETIKSLEEKERALGGAYAYEIRVGGAEEEREAALLSAVAGGYDASLRADAQGLKKLTELEDYQYFARLAKGEYTNIYLTLTIDGEGFDSTDAVNYENASGQLAFQFRAYYKDGEPVIITESQTIEGEPTIVPEVVNRVTSRVRSVKTGDTFPVIVVSAALGIGVVCLFLAMKSKKEDSSS